MIAAARPLARRVARPLVGLLERSGATPDGVTLLGLLLSCGAGVAAARGGWGLAALLLAAGGSCDLLDGELARRGTPTAAGAFLDSNLDRLSEAAIFLGLAWGLPGRTGPFAAAAALVASLLVSYARARGEGLGADCPSFGWERPHRLVLLIVALAVAAALPAPRAVLLIEWVCVAVAAGAGITALGRIVVIRRILRRREARP